MITTLALNPSIDLTNYISDFNYGGLNRTVSSRIDAGGKGLNVAVALSSLGSKSVYIGFMHKENEGMFSNKLKRNGTQSEFVLLEGHTRTNVKVVNISDGITTEINQSGSGADEESLRRMDALIAKYAGISDYMILTGSLPPGMGADYYGKIISSAKAFGCKCVLDADGERLRCGIKSKPYLIKPNRFELEQLTGQKADSPERIKSAALELVNSGIGIVAVSMGSDGAFITDGKQSYIAKAFDIEVKSTVGAGDSMVAALTHSLSEGKPLKEAFASGLAASAAACLVDGTDLFSMETYRGLMENAEITAV